MTLSRQLCLASASAHQADRLYSHAQERSKPRSGQAFSRARARYWYMHGRLVLPSGDRHCLIDKYVAWCHSGHDASGSGVDGMISGLDPIPFGTHLVQYIHIEHPLTTFIFHCHLTLHSIASVIASRAKQV